MQGARAYGLGLVCLIAAQKLAERKPDMKGGRNALLDHDSCVDSEIPCQLPPQACNGQARRHVSAHARLLIHCRGLNQ